MASRLKIKEGTPVATLETKFTAKEERLDTKPVNAESALLINVSNVATKEGSNRTTQSKIVS